jgi:mediator of RNA polymerase II transcription subunit 14
MLHTTIVIAIIYALIFLQVDPHDAARPLMVCHVPPLSATSPEADLATEKAIRSDHISMERLLVHSIYVRTKSRLNELRIELQRRLNLGDVEATLHGSPAVLSIPILQPCMR